MFCSVDVFCSLDIVALQLPSSMISNGDIFLPGQGTRMPDFVFIPQVLSAIDILQPPHIDYFEEMYPKQPSPISLARLLALWLTVITHCALAAEGEIHYV